MAWRFIHPQSRLWNHLGEPPRLFSQHRTKERRECGRRQRHEPKAHAPRGWQPFLSFFCSAPSPELCQERPEARSAAAVAARGRFCFEGAGGGALSTEFRRRRPHSALGLISIRGFALVSTFSLLVAGAEAGGEASVQHVLVLWRRCLPLNAHGGEVAAS